MPSIEFDGVSKRYGNVYAVNNLRIAIYPGELYGFLGPNGAGKTTAMKLAAGLVRPTNGVIRISGFDVQKKPLEAKRLIGFVPDSPYIYESLTGREFLHYCAGLYRLNGYETTKRVKYLFDRFNIGGWADKRAGEYSHGMKQRIVMASAFLHEPKVILIDEPMVGLDPAGVKLAKEVLRDFCRDGGAVFLSTHTLANAEELCNKVTIIKDGRVVKTGTLHEILKEGNRLEDTFLKLTSGGIPGV